jgi:hypothetical protein
MSNVDSTRRWFTSQCRLFVTWSTLGLLNHNFNITHCNWFTRLWVINIFPLFLKKKNQFFLFCSWFNLKSKYISWEKIDNFGGSTKTKHKKKSKHNQNKPIKYIQLIRKKNHYNKNSKTIVKTSRSEKKKKQK